MKNMNAQISENFLEIGEPVISVGDLRYSALSPKLQALEQRHQTLLQPCQEYWVRGCDRVSISEVDVMY